jgi:hypothetical protein
MDNKTIIDLITKDAQEIESITRNFLKYTDNKVPQIYIDLTLSKVKTLYTELQLLNKNIVTLEIKEIEDIPENLKIITHVQSEPIKENYLEVQIEIPTEIQTQVDKELQEEKVQQQALTDFEQLQKRREEHFLSTQLKYEPVADIKAAISLNEKIWFIKELFSGNIDIYNKTLEHFNKLRYLEEALDHIDENFKWDYEDDTVRDFMEYVYRRFF